MQNLHMAYVRSVQKLLYGDLYEKALEKQNKKNM